MVSAAMDVVAEFRRRRRRQLLAVIPALVMLFMYFWANERRTPDVVGIPRDMFEGIALLSLPPLLLFTVSNWRCPSCNEYVRGFNPHQCPKCGVSFR
jgi:hypothetical protein